MPNSTEQKNISDDLIAELARLMAEEAQADRPSDTETTSNAPSGKSEPGPGGDDVVRIPGAWSSSPSPSMPSTPYVAATPSPAFASTKSPSGSLWGHSLEAPEAANSDALPPEAPEGARVEPPPLLTTQAEIDDEAFLNALSQSALDGENEGPRRDFLSDNLDFTPDPAEPEAASMPNPPSHWPAEPAAPFDDPIAALITEQERADALFVPETPATPVPARPIEAARPVDTPQAAAPSPAEPIRAANRPQPTRTAPPPVTAHTGRVRAEESSLSTAPKPVAFHPMSPSDQSEDEVLALLNAMNGIRDRGVEPQRTDRGERDRFTASPILGRAQVKAPPTAKTADPLDEIETLIGDAVRLSRDETRSKSQDWAREPTLDDAAQAAEARIAAAAEESARPSRHGHKPSWTPVDETVLPVGAMSDPPQIPEADARQTRRGGNRVLIGAAAAATVLVAVALGVYWVFGINGETGGPVPVLVSNTNDAKVAPEKPAVSEDATQPVIFSELDGSAAPPADEQIVSRDQSEDVAVGDVRQVATTESAEESLANRKVRTVTVRPDGSIVSNDETVAANEVLPINRPNVPTLSSDDAAASDFQVSTAPAATAAETTPPATDLATTDPIASLVDSATSEVATGEAATTQEVVENAPYPEAMRPAASTFARSSAPAPQTSVPTLATTTDSPGQTIDLIASSANQVAAQLPSPATTTTAPNPPTATQTNVATAETAVSGPDAAAYVQLSSQRNMESANSTLATMRQRFGSLFNGEDAFVRRVDLGDLGVYYRVLVPANSLAGANGVCESVKTAGGDCFVRNN